MEVYTGIVISFLIICFFIFYLCPLYVQYLGKRFAAGMTEQIKGTIDFSLQAIQLIEGEQNGEKG